MTKKAHVMKRGIALLVGCLVGIPAVTQAAQERKSPLADAPAIRRRVELRNKRFELGVGLAATVGQDFYNALMLNLRLGFHITDWIGLSVSAGVYNLTPDWRSAFNDQLNSALPSKTVVDAANTYRNAAGQPPLPPDTKTPTKNKAAAAENRIGQVIMPQIDIVPFTGKFSAFSKLFMNYDVYVLAGPGFVNLVKKGTIDQSSEFGKATPYTGWKMAVNLGVGMHAFVNNYFAINVELHNLMYSNNAAGRDVTGSSEVNSADAQWTYNWMVGLNFMFFLPAQVKVSR